MENQLATFNAAAKSALCSFFDTYGEAATRLVPYSYAGGPKVGTIATLAVTLADFAARKNCDWDPDKPGPPAEGGWNDDGVCYKYEGAYPWLQRDNAGYGVYAEIFSITYVQRVFIYSKWQWEYDLVGISHISGEVITEKRYSNRDGPANFSTIPYGGSGDRPCLKGPNTDPDTGVEPLPPTHQYVTEEGCTLNVDMKGLIQDNDGSLHGVWQIAPADETRASGGVISGCNFYPTIYYDGGGSGGGGGTIPVPNPDPGGDWWKDKIAQALAGAAGNLAANAIRQLFEAKMPPSEFSFVAPCDKKEDGTPAEVIYQFDEQNYQSRVLSQQAVLMEILQQHLNWKTPTCNAPSPKGAYARSITFASDENTLRGNRRCVKRFGYRSTGTCDLETLYEHWRCFVWNTGPVIVGHRGSHLGTPQVWAYDIDEGKRVIQHAGAEAGVDPDKVGEWTIGGSDHPRYGVSHTVKLMEVRGLWQATAREGPDGFAKAVWTLPAP